MPAGPYRETRETSDQAYRIWSDDGTTWAAERSVPLAQASAALSAAIGAGQLPADAVLSGEQLGTIDTGGTITAQDIRFWVPVAFGAQTPRTFGTPEAAWDAVDAFVMANPIREIREWLIATFPDMAFPESDTTPQAMIAAATAMGIPVWDYVHAIGNLAVATGNGPTAVMQVVTENGDLLGVWGSLATTATGRTPKVVPFAALAPLIRALILFGLSGEQITNTIWAFIDTL